MKARKAYFRSWDHQLVQEAYPFTVKPKGEMKDKWDMLVLGERGPGRRARRSKSSTRPKSRIPATMNRA